MLLHSHFYNNLDSYLSINKSHLVVTSKNKLKSIKVAKWRKEEWRLMKEWMKNDEGWMMNKEWWIKNDEWWMMNDEMMKDDNFKQLRADKWTDRLIYRWTFVIVEWLSRLKTVYLNKSSKHMGYICLRFVKKLDIYVN